MVPSRDTSRQEAGMSPRSPEQLFLPACSWPARIADQSAVRAGARERAAAIAGEEEKAPTSEGGRCTELVARMGCAQTKELDVV
jgi:hypothetical protein